MLLHGESPAAVRGSRVDHEQEGRMRLTLRRLCWLIGDCVAAWWRSPDRTRLDCLRGLRVR
jgi:hypothetical protein